jgi:hypothetical protein
VDLLVEHFGELVVGFVLSVFAWAFSSWSGTVKRIATEFSRYRLEMERRVTMLEAHVAELERLCDENRRRHNEQRK